MQRETDCIFCKMVAGEVSCTKVLDDENALAFMDIAPLAEGHVLLIPKEHYVTMGELPSDLAGAVFRHIPSLVHAVQSATGCEGVNVLQNNGSIAGQLVPHVHVHIIPRNPGGKFKFNWPAGEYEAGRMDILAEAICEHVPAL